MLVWEDLPSRRVRGVHAESREVLADRCTWKKPASVKRAIEVDMRGRDESIKLLVIFAKSRGGKGCCAEEEECEKLARMRNLQGE